MLSFGTELPLAFAIASARVGLPPGSPPPVRAATSTFLISLANSLPRRASTTAFLCLVVAHLEWPLTLLHLLREVRDVRHEVLVDAGVAGQLGMECRSKQRPLPHHDDLTVAPCEDRRLGTGRLRPRRANEDAVDLADPLNLDGRLERVDLA